MTWARVVDDEVVEIFDEDPALYFHPDLLHEWVDIPDHGIHCGWKIKNNVWISGTQWSEEFVSEHPLPPEGPPSANIEIDHKQTRTHDQIKLSARISGSVTSYEWTVDNVIYTTEDVVLELEKTDVDMPMSISLKAIGPGGDSVKTLEGEESLVRTAFFTPLFQSRS